MRKMADETSEDLGPEFAEVVEAPSKAGEDPESIEESAAGPGRRRHRTSAGPGADDFGVM